MLPAAAYSVCSSVKPNSGVEMNNFTHICGQNSVSSDLQMGEGGSFWSRPADKFSTSDVFRPIQQAPGILTIFLCITSNRYDYFEYILISESTDLFVEDPAFLPSCDLAPLPPPPPSIVRRLSLFLSLAVCRRSSLLTGEGEGVGGGGKLYDGEKAKSSINHLYSLS